MKTKIILLLLLWQNFAFAQVSVFNFRDLTETLPEGGYWNGSDQSGKFVTQTDGVSAVFYNEYNADYGSWSGFAYSCLTDDSTGTYQNQYSTFAGTLLSDSPYDTVFVLGYVPVDYQNDYDALPIGMSFSQPVAVQSVYIANTTYTALTIRDGNSYADPFSQGDFFYLVVRGYNNGEYKGQVEYYLADYRGEEYFLQKNWRCVWLAALGSVDSLTFELVSSDVGDYGMNTPAYFCIDRLSFDKTGLALVETSREVDLKAYPNPTVNYLFLSENVDSYSLYSVEGKKIISGDNTNRIDVSALEAGMYILKYSIMGSTGSLKVIKK